MAAAGSEEADITNESLEAALLARLKDLDYVKVTDISAPGSDCGKSFEAVIVSPLFEGDAPKSAGAPRKPLNTLKRHRLVNGALREELPLIHAWSISCFTPAEWEKTGRGGAAEGDAK